MKSVSRHMQTKKNAAVPPWEQQRSHSFSLSAYPAHNCHGLFWVNMRCPFSYPRFASRLFNSPSPLIQRRRRCDALRGLVSGNSFTARSQNLIDFKANPPFLRQNWQTIPRCLSKTGGRSGRKHHRKRAVPHFRPCEPYILFRPAPLSPHIGFRECRK